MNVNENAKKIKKTIDRKRKKLYNNWAWNLALKLNVATSLRKRRMEGTSVEYVLARPGGKFNFNNYIRALIPESSCEFLGF